MHVSLDCLQLGVNQPNGLFLETGLKGLEDPQCLASRAPAEG